MGSLPNQPLTIQPEEVAAISQMLSTMRHNVNNHLSLIVAATELIKRKPDLAPRMLDNMTDQPDKIIAEIRKFSEEFERLLHLPGVEGNKDAPQ